MHKALEDVMSNYHVDRTRIVVAGYQGGEINPLNKTVIVHQFDAHAWADAVVDHAVSRASELADYLDTTAFVQTRLTAYRELTEYLRQKFGEG